MSVTLHSAARVRRGYTPRKPARGAATEITMAAHADTHALITGGTQGLGYAVGEQLVREGCRHLVLVGRDGDKGRAAARRLCAQAPGVNAHFLQADLADACAADALVGRAAPLLGGRLNALVNSAADTARAPLHGVTAAAFDRAMAVNARAPLLLMQALAARHTPGAVPYAVVNVGSVAAHCGPANLAPYNASKAALACLTKNLAHALRGRMRVNCVNVGWMDTPAEDVVQRAEGAPPDWLARAEAAQPFKSLVKADQVARQVALFLSPASGVVTGAVLDWDQHVVGRMD